MSGNRRPVYGDLPTTADVVVIGAGIVGLAVAREFARRGSGVVVVERDAPAAGTSSRGEGNMLVSDKEIRAEAELTLRSIDLWEAFADESPLDVEYERKGGIVAARTPAAADRISALAADHERWGIRSERLEGDALADAEPHLSPDVPAGVYYPDDAQIQPILACRALLDSVLDLGGVVVPGCEVVGARRTGNSLVVETSTGSISSPAVVCAAGPWSGSVADRLGGRAPVFPRRGLLLVTEALPPGAIRHKVYDGGYVDAVASDEAAAQCALVVEGTRAGTVLIGSTRESVGWDRTLPWDLVGVLARAAVEMFPFLADVSVIRAYQGFRPATPDHLPLIGPDPVVPGLYHATGHEGAGIGLALATGELLARIVETGEMTPFDPGRETALEHRRVVDHPPADLALVPPEGVRADPTTVPLPTLATSWLGEGRFDFRTTRLSRRPRSFFCGIGDCFDCLATDERGRTVRSCLVGERTVTRRHAPGTGP